MKQATSARRKTVTAAKLRKRSIPHTLHQKDFLSYRLSVLSRVIDRVTDVALARDFALQLTESRVLGQLAMASPVTVRELAGEMHLDKAQVSRALTRLVKLGHVARAGDPVDKRSAIFSVTGEGRAVYREMLERGRAGQRRLIAQLDEDEYTALSSAIDKLLDRIKNRA